MDAAGKGYRLQKRGLARTVLSNEKRYRAIEWYLPGLSENGQRERIMELTGYLIEGLKKQNIRIVSPVEHPDERSPIVSFTLHDKNEICLKKLNEKKIYVSPRAGNLRVSVNIFNNFADIDRLLEALEEI